MPNMHDGWLLDRLGLVVGRGASGRRKRGLVAAGQGPSRWDILMTSCEQVHFRRGQSLSLSLGTLGGLATADMHGQRTVRLVTSGTSEPAVRGEARELGAEDQQEDREADKFMQTDDPAPQAILVDSSAGGALGALGAAMTDPVTHSVSSSQSHHGLGKGRNRRIQVTSTPSVTK